MSMLVNVIGMGYIGLPTALMMAAHGVDVIGTDYNSERIRQLQENKQEESQEHQYKEVAEHGGTCRQSCRMAERIPC